jgi:8-oxo-dGTP pyrophosphatase MutT (NUDIX family)
MPEPAAAWPALAAARAHDPGARVPFRIDTTLAGSVAREHLGSLGHWPGMLRAHRDGVTLEVPAARRDAVLADINARLRQQGLVRAWRDETFTVFALEGAGQPLARTERAAARFWGTLTLGAHATGWVADAHGRPSHLWIARRALTKATDPGLHDNLVGGGVPAGQTPWQALLREGWEEAGLAPELMAQARPGRVLRLQRDIAEGLQLEDLHSHDLQLPAGLVPRNQDGEVAAFECLPVADALALAVPPGAGGTMTVDAALVTLDFATRHGLVSDPALAAALDALAAPFTLRVRRDQSP